MIGMPQGLKQSSSVVSIGFSVEEKSANTFQQESIDLNLSPLDREVFVVLAVNLDGSFPDAIDGTNTLFSGSLTTTSQTDISDLSNSNCLSVLQTAIRAGGFAEGGVPFTSQALETPPSTLEYIGIIATNDFFVQCKGVNNLAAKGINGKMYGYRAVASADIYAALVQSEVLSA
tara:strand:- start:34 stop:555 length:522 start_codon:yes stop_codon:yes gene_type:complete